MAENTPIVGTCLYCGRNRLVSSWAKTDTEEEINKKATQECDCEQSAKAQEFATIRTNAAKNVDELFTGEDLEDMANILKASVLPIMEGSIDSVTVNSKSGTTGRVWKTSNKTATVKVERVDTTKTAKES